MGNHGAEFLSYNVKKVEFVKHPLLEIHVSSDSCTADFDVNDCLFIEDDLDDCKGLKKIVVKDLSVGNVTKRVAKHFAAMAVIVGINTEAFRCYSNQLAQTMAVLDVHKGRVIFKRGSFDWLRDWNHVQSLKLNSRLKFSRYEIQTTSLRNEEQLPMSEYTDLHTCRNDLRCNNTNGSLEYGNITSLRSISVVRRELPESIFGWPLLSKTTSTSLDGMEKAPLSPISLFRKELSDSSLGWPLLRKTNPASLDGMRYLEDSDMSVVQWAMNLPSRTTQVFQHMYNDLDEKEYCAEREITKSRLKMNEKCSEASRKLRRELELQFKRNSNDYRWFSYEELKDATSEFSSECVVGEGGCSSVYRGFLFSGKPVAVKILKEYKEAWTDFSFEVNIISSLQHRYIAPLIGVCIEDNYLIAVYDFFPEGNLEENLQGYSGKSVLPWEVRYNLAISVAEALKYMHDECPRPIIHRDVKSSNILLTINFQPQLSDFGLATYGPTESSYMIDSNVVGTFGYIAPEYFMHGRVSNKIDVYSFGVVLLELLSGRRAVGSNDIKGKTSLVKWAKTLLQSSNLNSLLDPKLDGEFDVVQMHSMVLAATLCIKQSARLRPKISEILNVLRGDVNANQWVKPPPGDLKEAGNEDCDDVYPEFNCRQHLSVVMVDNDDDTSSASTANLTYLSNVERKKRLKLKDYLNEPDD